MPRNNRSSAAGDLANTLPLRICRNDDAAIRNTAWVVDLLEKKCDRTYTAALMLGVYDVRPLPD